MQKKVQEFERGEEKKEKKYRRKKAEIRKIYFLNKSLNLRRFHIEKLIYTE
jgi:hypothetical protein